MLACGEQIRRAYIDASSMKQESLDFSHERFNYEKVDLKKYRKE